MKKAYKDIVFAALLLGFAACSQEDDFIQQMNHKDAPLAIATAGVTNLVTRATIADGYLAGGSIGVYVTSQSDKARYKGSNVEWKYNNNSWELVSADAVVLYQEDPTAQSIAAYYPYTGTLTGEGICTISLPSAYGSNYEDYDYLYADYTALNNNPMPLTMKHLLAKVEISVTGTGTNVDGGTVASIALMDTPKEADWQIPGGTVTAGDGGLLTTYYDEDTEKYHALAIPHEAEAINLFITMNDGSSYHAKASLTQTDGELKQGMLYSIGLRIGKDKVIVSGIDVNDWGAGGTLNDKTATELKNVTYTIDSAIATFTLTADATAAELQDAVTSALNEGATTLFIRGTLNEDLQKAIAAALNDADSITLVLDMDEDSVCTELSGLENVTLNNGYIIASDGTYEVYNAHGLSAWGEAANTDLATNLTLKADIVLSADGITVTDGVPSASNWTPVGLTSDSYYKGTIDGRGFKIYNLTVNRTEIYSGFVGCMYGGVIKNLTLVNATVASTKRWVGAIVGYVNTGAVINCHVTGASSVTSTYNANNSIFVGGVVGSVYGTDGISGCSNSAQVSTPNLAGSYRGAVGGIAGRSASPIINCYNFGNVTAISGNSVAGIVGYLDGDNPLVSGCYNTGAIEASSIAGGIVGVTGATVAISDCYNRGSVTVTSEKAGGIIGGASSELESFTISNCYNTGAVSAPYYCGGIFSGFYDADIKTYTYYLEGCAIDGSQVVQNGEGNATAGSTTADVDGESTMMTVTKMKSADFLASLQQNTADDAAYEWISGVDGYPTLQQKTVSE